MTDILDIRMLASEWRNEIIGVTRPSELDDVTRPYRDLCDELGVERTPDDLERYGDDREPTLINEDYFEQYAEQLAEDIGAIDPNANWPLTCIDWAQAADELKVDYRTVEYDGETYYLRSV